MPIQKQETWFNFTVTSADGKTERVTYKNEKQYKEAVAEADKIGAVITDVVDQLFILTTCENMSEFPVLLPDEERQLERVNYSLSLAQQNERRDTMRDPNFVPQTEAIDLINLPAVQNAPTGRAPADPRKQLKSTWSKVHGTGSAPTEAEITEILEFMEKLKARRASQPEPTADVVG
jgi:hypothetical protein